MIFEHDNLVQQKAIFFKSNYKRKEVKSMVYIHEQWTLYTRIVHLKGGRSQEIYFFSKRTPPSGTPCDMPDGYTVGVNKRTGFLYLKRK